MAGIAKARSRGFVGSSFAVILVAALAVPTTTDARGGGGGFGGHGTAIGGHAHFGRAAPVRNAGPAVAGPAAVSRSFSFAQRSSAFPPSSFSRRDGAFRRQRAFGSHFFTLGADGVWLDNFVYAPTVFLASGMVIARHPAQSRRPMTVKTPSAQRPGIILVRGDDKCYVVFPGRERG